MKKTLLLLLPLFVLISFSSCEKGDGFKDKDDWGDKEEWDDKGECLKLVYPVTYTMPDESTITGDDEKSVWTAIKAWYEANEETEKKPELVYPVEVVFENDEIVRVETEEEMITIKEDCNEEWETCEWNEATEASGDEFEKIIVEELVYSEECGCNVSGFEKFLKNGQTRFLIYYKTDDCVGYGYKITCENGDCENEETQKCKFLQDCE